MNKLTSIMLTIFILLGCSSKPLVVSTATKFWLSEKELKISKVKALKGNSMSALKVANFYANVKYDLKEIEFWYRLSAEQGNKDSALSLAYYYKEVFKEPEKAIYWYESVGSYRPDYVGYDLGELYANKGLFDKAVSAYCQAYVGGSEHGPSAKLSTLYLDQKKYIEAMAWGIIRGNELTSGSYAWKENNAKLAGIQKNMTQSEIVKAQSLADTNVLCVN